MIVYDFNSLMILLEKDADMRKKKMNATIPNDYAMLSLTPKPALIEQIRQLSDVWLDIPAGDLEGVVDEDCLKSHTVPICIPMLRSSQEFYQFISEHAEMLIDLMLTAWPFPNHLWGFKHKNMDLIEEMVDVKYYHRVFKSVATPVVSTLDLSVTFAVPTETLKDYFVELVASKKIKLSDDELNYLEFLLASGVAIISNKINKDEYQSIENYFRAVNNPKTYSPLSNEKLAEALLKLFFINPSTFSEEKLEEHIDEWFTLTTYTGLYLLIEPENRTLKAS